MNVYMMHLTDLVYDLLIACRFLLDSAGYLIRVGRLMDTHMTTRF